MSFKRFSGAFLIALLLTTSVRVLPASAAIVFGAATSNANAQSGSATLVLTTPASTAVGDFLLASIEFNGGSNKTITAPAGWTLILRQDRATDTGMATYQLVATTTGAVAYTWKIGLTNDRASGGIIRYTGVDAANPIVTVSGSQNTNTATAIAPSVTTTANNQMVVNLFGNDSSKTLSTPIGSSLRFDVVNPNNSGPRIIGTDYVQAVAGATGTKVASSSPGNDDWAAQSIVLKSAITNVAPVLASIPTQNVAEGSLLSFVANATDANGDTLVYSLIGTSTPVGASINSSTGVFTWTPTEAQGPGTYSFTAQVSDGEFTNSKNFIVNVSEVNTAPVLASIGNKSVNENANLHFTISATDSDIPANTLTYSASNLPTGATFNAATREFDWTPTFTDAGTYPNVHFSVSDGVTSTSEDITITVNNVDRAPVLNTIGNQTGSEGSGISFTVSGSDPDGDAVTYSATNLPTGATFDGTTFSWTPDFSQSGNYSVTFTATDTGSLTDSEVVPFDIGNVNRSPVLATISDYTGESAINETPSEPFTFTASATDPDEDTVSYSLQNAPTGASIDSTTGVFTWTPAEDQGGSTYTFSVCATDNAQSPLSDCQEVNVEVREVNTAPQAEDQEVTNNEDYEDVITLGASDSDIPTQELTYRIETEPEHGTLSLEGNIAHYMPNANYNGNDSFTFIVNDGELDSRSATVSIYTRPVDDAPVITLNGDAYVIIPITALFNDPGAKVTDVDEPERTDYPIVVTGNVDINNYGDYVLTYSYTYSDIIREIAFNPEFAQVPTQDVTISVTRTVHVGIPANPPSPAGLGDTPPQGGGGGGAFVGQGVSVTPVSSYSSQGRVLGASIGPSDSGSSSTATTTCDDYLKTYIKYGGKNDVDDVKKLQKFLNKELGLKIPITGRYGFTTMSALQVFQVKYADLILKPWMPFGLSDTATGTGYMYKTTRSVINMMMCGKVDSNKLPQLP